MSEQAPEIVTESAGKVDAVVIGGGHNALVAAAYMARAGKRVVLCEASNRLGGGAVTAEIAPGFRAPACAHTVSGLPPRIIRDLKLKRRGLTFAQTKMHSLALDEDGRHIPIGGDLRRMREAVFHWSRHDADALPDFMKRMRRLARALAPLLSEQAPLLQPRDWHERLPWARFLLRLHLMGSGGFAEALRTIPGNAADLVEDAFETDLLKGGLAFQAVLGGRFGPRAPGTAFTWLWRMAAEEATRLGTVQVRGGPGALTDALAASAKGFGTELRTGARVKQIRVEDGAACGVVLSNGDEIRADTVISCIDPKATFLKLVGARHLDAGLTGELQNVRLRASSAKLNLALDRLPHFDNAAPEDLQARLIISPSVEELERASNALKYGEMSGDPVMEVTIPTLADPDLAPPGQHVLSAIIQYTPFELAGGWDKGGDALVARAVKTLARFAPDLPDHIVAGEILPPPDIERVFGIAGGDWHQGEMTIDQALMMRPVPRLAAGEPPVAGLVLGGAGAHPGGGIMGIAGRFAARRALQGEGA